MSNSESSQHQQVVDAQSQASTGHPSPLSPQYSTSHVPSPPPAGSSVRRHQSLTHGVHTSSSAGLRRAGTLQAGGRHRPAGHSPSPPHEEEYIEEQELVNPYEDENYFDFRSPPPPSILFKAKDSTPQALWGGPLLGVPPVRGSGELQVEHLPRSGPKILTISLVHCPISTSTTTTSMSAMRDIKEVSPPILPDSTPPIHPPSLPLVCGRGTCRVPTLARPANCSWTLDLTGARRLLSPGQRQAARPHTFR
jgi:hypothetical protein